MLILAIIKRPGCEYSPILRSLLHHLIALNALLECNIFRFIDAGIRGLIQTLPLMEGMAL